MTHVQKLLNDDGSASVATALMTSHHGFRLDLAQFSIALGRLPGAERLQRLREEWVHFRVQLHGPDSGAGSAAASQCPAKARASA